MNEATVSIPLPASVPRSAQQIYLDRYNRLTHGTNNLALFIATQRLETLNLQFYGPTIHPDALHPTHLFALASEHTMGGFLTHLGLMARYANQYPKIPYIIQLDALCTATGVHELVATVDDVITFAQQTGIPVYGIACSLILDQTCFTQTLNHVARAFTHAHRHGLVTFLRGDVGSTYVGDKTADLGAIAVSLDTDFLILNPSLQPETLRIAAITASNTKILCTESTSTSFPHAITTLYQAIVIGGAYGCAYGPALFQSEYQEAIRRMRILNALVYKGMHPEQALHDSTLS